jgi:uncharacterized protein (TIGR03118 family)
MRGRAATAIAGSALALVLIVGIGLGSSADAATDGYKVTRLVSDRSGVAATRDKNLVNAWGLAAGPSTFWWTANNGTDTTTLFDGAGTPQSLVVGVKGSPSGTVFNGETGFTVTDGTTTAPALFLFSTEGGTIRGWSPTVGTMTPPSTHTEKVVDRTSKDAIYKGLAIASTPNGDMLYATDFHNARVDVFDESFHLVKLAGAFQDPNIPSTFAPFGIQAIGGDIFVTYAKQDADAEDDASGRHRGYVDEFDTGGMLVQRIATRGPLNSPWGLAMAPADFGTASSDLLVGNFGNGRIHAYAMPTTSSPMLAGTLSNASGTAIAIDGLWGLGFGNGGNAGPTNSLYFTAGPHDEAHGLFGSITVAGP